MIHSLFVRTTVLSTVLYLGAFGASTLFAQGVEFEHGTWDEVLAKAQREEKPIFVDAYTTWCGPCKWMSKEVFPQTPVGSYINSHFVAYKMDMEKGEGPAFAKANNVMAYPTLLYFDSQGNLLHKAAGARDAEGLIQLSKDALSPEKQLGGFIQRYKDGAREKAFLKQYLTLLAPSGEDITKPLQEYWDQTSSEEKHSASMLEMMGMATNYFGNIEEPLTQYLIEHRSDYEGAVGKKKIRSYLWRTYTQEAIKLAVTRDKEKYKKIEAQLLAIFPEAKKDLKHRVRLVRAAQKFEGNEKRIQRYYNRYLKFSLDGNDLNDAAWAIYENPESSTKDLEKALSYANRAVEYSPDYSTYDTKGALLFRLEQYEAAKTAYERSLADAKEQGIPEEYVTDTRERLSKINVLLGEQEE